LAAAVAAGGARGLLRVGRARRARPGAVLRRIALARRRATEGATVARRMLAGVARAVALVRAARVAVIGAGRAGRALGVRGARRGRRGGGLRRIALAGREPAGRRRRLERVGRTRRARAGAVLVHVAGTRCRAADGARVARRMLAGVARPVALIAAAWVAVVRARRARRALRV